MRTKAFFRWYDLWVGAYWDRYMRTLYICPIPMFGVAICFRPTIDAEDARRHRGQSEVKMQTTTKEPQSSNPNDMATVFYVDSKIELAQRVVIRALRSADDHGIAPWMSRAADEMEDFYDGLPLNDEQSHDIRDGAGPAPEVR